MELGIYAQQPHIGKTKHFLESNYEEWFIPVSKVEKPLHYPIITIQGQQFYLAHSVPAKPFMRPAEFKTREENKEIVTKKINEMIREVAK